jgi:hypothetical protein
MASTAQSNFAAQVLNDDSASLAPEHLAELLDVVERPGRGIALSGCKVFYERTSGARFYELMQGHHGPDMFYRVCGVTPNAFDSLLHECRAAIEQPFSSRMPVLDGDTAIYLRVPRVRAFSSHRRNYDLVSCHVSRPC